jgi:hypothetical protein
MPTDALEEAGAMTRRTRAWLVEQESARKHAKFKKKKTIERQHENFARARAPALTPPRCSPRRP